MLYFHNTSEEIQKLATYAADSFQLLGAFDSQTAWAGLCSWTPLGAQPQTSSIFSQCLLFPPNLGCLDSSLHNNEWVRMAGHCRMDSDGRSLCSIGASDV